MYEGQTTVGYKVVYRDWTTRQNGSIVRWSLGETVHHNGTVNLCESGLHFCEKLSDCFKYHPFVPWMRVLRVEAGGEIIRGDDKSASSQLTPVSELSYAEVESLLKEEFSSKATNGSEATNWSKATNESEATNWSAATNGSKAVGS